MDCFLVFSFLQNGVPLEFQNVPGPAPHRVLIASEEQFKIFSLPQLKPVNKYKLTAHEGARVRRIAFATFMCTVPTSSLVNSSPPKALVKPASPAAPAQQAADPPTTAADNNTSTTAVNDNNTSIVGSDVTTHYEISLLCLTNLGDCLVLTVPELRRQLNSAAVRREDIKYVQSKHSSLFPLQNSHTLHVTAEYHRSASQATARHCT